MLLASCTNDTETLFTEQAKKLELEVSQGETLTITPLSAKANTEYRWYIDGKLVATTPTLLFKGTKPGLNTVVLKARTNGVEATTTYAVNVTIQLATTLNAFTLNSTNGTATTGGYYWNQTYSNTQFTSGIFTFSHSGGPVSGYSYWDGFTVSNTADITDYGAPGSSNGWIAHQWGSMAVPSASSNFLVGYWGYYMKDFQSGLTTFTEAGFSNWVKLYDSAKPSATYTPIQVSVSIHPWPYYGILHGDGFARAFAAGDYFLLKIYGVTASNQIVGPVNHYMVDYRNGITPSINVGWTPVNVSSLGAVRYLMFQMETTDSDPVYGPNTAVYFCLNNIKVVQNS